MLDAVTWGQLRELIIGVAAIITACGVITTWVSKKFEKKVLEAVKPLQDSIDEMHKRLNEAELDGLKNYLTGCLARIELNMPMPEIEKERFWESYGRYRELGGNHYIKEKVEDLRKDDRL